MVSEIECVEQCIASQSPVIGYINYALIAIIAISALLLIFFGKRLSLRKTLVSKSVFITAVFLLLITLFVGGVQHLTIFSIAHTLALFGAIIFFAASFLFANLIVKMGLEKAETPEALEKMLAEEADKNAVKKPQLFVFRDANPNAFTVSGLRKVVFLSTGIIERLDEKELRLVIVHELMHLKSGFFTIKRFFHSVKAGFFGLLPLNFEEFEILEEHALDRKMLKSGLNLSPVRKKLD
ncbi:MAG: M56 family metallopeptidase [Candidatus Diapherotrites archaeon]